MNKEAPIIHNAHTDILPPPESETSVVLNGIGNGMMLGTGPFMAMELYSQIRGKDLPKSFYKGCAFMTVAGCVLGAIYGVHESRKLDTYRNNINDEIKNLRADNQALKDTIQSWTQKHQDRQREPETATSR